VVTDFADNQRKIRSRASYYGVRFILTKCTEYLDYGYFGVTRPSKHTIEKTDVPSGKCDPSTKFDLFHFWPGVGLFQITAAKTLVLVLRCYFLHYF